MCDEDVAVQLPVAAAHRPHVTTLRMQAQITNFSKQGEREQSLTSHSTLYRSFRGHLRIKIYQKQLLQNIKNSKSREY